MTTEQIFALITVVLTTINAALTYFNIRHSRKKDFQDKLYGLKLDAYNTLNLECLKSIQRLDINSSPFVEIYEHKTKEDWEKYCKIKMGPQIHQSLELEQLIFQYAILLPSDIIEKYREFANRCISFITMVYHFDTSLIIENQDKLWELYADLTNSYRNDLEIEKIDQGLRQRINSKI